jgi:hypothetical protein
MRFGSTALVMMTIALMLLALMLLGPTHAKSDDLRSELNNSVKTRLAKRSPLAAALAASGLFRMIGEPREVGGYVESVFGANDDDNVGRFGFVGLQTIRIGVAPAGDIHHLRRLDTCPTGLGRFYDV